MPATTVIVQHHDGSPARNVRVSLGFSSGSTQAAFTDSHGQCTIRHSSTGQATVFVSGNSRATVHCPGTVSVTI